jgi:tRNA A37 threonylcarbamoyladenosine dehydratase
MIASAQTITVIAVNPEDDNNSASATISLTSDAIALVPAKVELMAQQSQQFIAVIAGCSTGAAGRVLPGLLSRV